MSQTAGALGSHRLTVKNIPLRQTSPSTWGDSVNNWESYLAQKAEESLVFVGSAPDNFGEIVTAPYSHRFTQGYTEMQYAKIKGFCRGVLTEYDDPHFTFLTLSSTYLSATGDPRPPLDHLDELLGSWRPETGTGLWYELTRVMEGDRKRDPWEPRPEWEYLLILEPTTEKGVAPGGYAHVHVAVVCDGPVESARFESVIGRHLELCPGAGGNAHEFADAIEVSRPASSSVRAEYRDVLESEGREAAQAFAEDAEGLADPGSYLFKYLGKSWNAEAMADYEKRFAAVLFEEGRQRFRASNGAQRWMQRDESESETGRWTFEGIVENDRLADLRRFDDADLFCDAHGVHTVNEWVTGRLSLAGERAARGETFQPTPEPRPGEWSFAGLTADRIGTYVQEAQARERGDPPPGEVLRGRAEEGDRPPPQSA